MATVSEQEILRSTLQSYIERKAQSGKMVEMVVLPHFTGKYWRAQLRVNGEKCNIYFDYNRQGWRKA